MVRDDLSGFGDARLRSVGVPLLRAMRRQSSMCRQARAADRNAALAPGRCLDHSGVSRAKLLLTAGGHVLAIQNASELNFPDHVDSKRGCERSGNGRDIGRFPTVAVDAEHGGVVGLRGAQVINRTGGKVAAPRTRPAAAKRSQSQNDRARPEALGRTDRRMEHVDRSQ